MSENLNNAQVDLPDEEEDRKDNIQRVEAEPKPRRISVRNQFDNERIMVRFVGNSNRFGAHTEQKISIGMKSRLEKYMRIYGLHVGVRFEQLRFLFDGRRLEASKSAKHYGLEEDDQIDVFEWQTGGAVAKRGHKKVYVPVMSRKTTIWDLVLEEDEPIGQMKMEEEGGEEKGEQTSNERHPQLPPQLLFIHMGQNEVKTALDGFHVFKTINC